MRCEREGVVCLCVSVPDGNEWKGVCGSGRGEELALCAKGWSGAVPTVQKCPPYIHNMV